MAAHSGGGGHLAPLVAGQVVEVPRGEEQPVFGAQTVPTAFHLLMTFLLPTHPKLLYLGV